MKIGTQIAYLPDHANGDLNHPDVEFGFVSTLHRNGKDVFCRYWKKGEEGEVLRTLSCSELTPKRNIIMHNSTSRLKVEAALDIIIDVGYRY